MQRWPSHVRQELVDAAGPEPELPGTPVTPGDVEDALAIADVGYTHAVMVQCFFPQRPISGLTYDTTHGRASLSIEAGRLIKPDVFGEIIQCAVPSGAKARLILPYIIGEAVRTASPEIDLGRSLRTFMERLGMPVGGSNGQKITAEIQNIAAATIMLGEWADDRARMRAGRMAKELSFWLERNPDQQSFWTPTMTLSAEFFAAIQDHRVPINMHHLAHLARSPRAHGSLRVARVPNAAHPPASPRARLPARAAHHLRAGHHTIPRLPQAPPKRPSRDRRGLPALQTRGQRRRRVARAIATPRAHTDQISTGCRDNEVCESVPRTP